MLEKNSKDHSSERTPHPRDTRHESGFSLMAVLVAVIALGGVLSTAALYESGESRVAKARSAGWHLATVSRAARLYVRNNSVATAGGLDENGDGTPDDTFTKTILSAGPQEIPIATLIASGLLPPGFEDRNALNQPIHVYAANYPLNGDPGLPGTAATAYVYLEPSTDSSAILMQVVADAARENGLSVLAPTLNAAGVPAEDCQSDGVPDVALWDTGCLSDAQFTAITGVPFTPGSLMAPAWRSMPHDPRAVMRYEQPENPEPARMVANLMLGTEDLDDTTGECLNKISIYEPESNGITYAKHETGLCEVLPDQPGLAGLVETDRRVDIINVNTLSVDRIIALPQGPAEVRRIIDPATGDLSLDVAGDDVDSGLSNDIDASSLESLSVAGNFQAKITRSSGKISTSNYSVQLIKPDGVTPGDLTISENVYARNLSGNGMPTAIARANFFSQNLKMDSMDALSGDSGVGVINNLEVEGDSTFDNGITIKASSVTTGRTISVKNAYIDAVKTGNLSGDTFNTKTFIVSPTETVPTSSDPADWVDPVKIGTVNTVTLDNPDFYDPSTLNLDWRKCQGVCPQIQVLGGTTPSDPGTTDPGTTDPGTTDPGTTAPTTP